MALKAAAIGGLGAANAIPGVGPAIVDGIAKGVEIYNGVEWNKAKIDVLHKVVDKGIDLASDQTEKFNKGLMNGCNRAFNRTFTLISSWNSYVLAVPVQAGNIGIAYLTHKTRSDEFCTKLPADIGCQTASYAFASTLVVGVVGAAWIGYKAII